MRKIRFAFTFAVLLALLVGSAAFAQTPGDNPEGINTFEVSPDPAYAGDTVTLDINFNATAGANGDTATAFCLYAPDTAVDTPASNSFPASITLSYYSGFTQYTATFTGASSGCPARSGQTGWMYSSGTGLPSGDTTYDGSANFNIASSATAGFYDWTLLLQEPGSGVNPLSYTNFEIKNVGTPDTGLSGRLIDSKTLQPWAYGAEIQVVQVTGDNIGLKGSTYAASDGTWSITFATTDDLGLCGGACTTGNEYAVYRVVVNFTCDLQTGNGTRPDYQTSDDGNCPITVGGTDLTGLPINFETEITDAASGSMHNVGDMETGRGPTAIVLEDFSSAQVPWAPMAGAALLLVAAGGLAILRKRWL